MIRHQRTNAVARCVPHPYVRTAGALLAFAMVLGLILLGGVGVARPAPSTGAAGHEAPLARALDAP